MAGKTTTAPKTVKDIMTSDPVYLSADATARELAHVLEANAISGVPVVDVCMRVIGVVSRTDLLHCCVAGPVGSRPGSFFQSLAEGIDPDVDFGPESLGNVEEFMTTDPVTATVNETIPEIAGRMAEQNVHRVIVVDDDGHVVGVVTTLDVLKVYPD
jgi:CBS domain-containing protein